MCYLSSLLTSPLMKFILTTALIAATACSAFSKQLKEDESIRKVDPVKTDTVECLYHQVMSDHKPALSWKKGFIITENDQIKIGTKAYPIASAPSLTGVISNKILRSDRKVVTNKVIQIVIL
jgi:hypothetical protein